MKKPVKIVEQEPKIVTTYGTFTQKQWDNMTFSKKPLKKDDRKYCPFRRTTCTSNCALWNDNDCRIKSGGNLKTTGLCPISGSRCNEKCAMFQDNNCVLF